MTLRSRTRLFALALGASALALTALPADAQQQDRQNRQAMQQQSQQQQQQQSRRDAAPMQYRQVRGTVQDFRRVPVQGSDQPAILVLLRTESGRNAVVDLGTERLGIRLSQGDMMSVRGVPVTVGDRRIILQANAINVQDRTYDINRPALRQPRQAQAGMMQEGRGQDGSQRGQGGMARVNLRTYDANNDNRLTPRELGAGLYYAMDRNNNGVVTPQELDRGINRLFGAQDLDVQGSDWDYDGDGRVIRSEFRRGLTESGLYDRMDRNGNGRVAISEARRFLQG